MTSSPITRDRVLGTQKELPAFPKVVLQILDTLNDPDACLTVLTEHIEHDPVVAASVLSLANRAGTHSHSGAPISDVFTAVSLVGLARVRDVALQVSLSGFLGNIAQGGAEEHIWEHSLACAACGVELAQWVSIEVSADAALIAGLMHDVGQLWLQRFEPHRMQQALLAAKQGDVHIEAAERSLLGVDHGAIGGWLAQSWGLPDNIGRAIVHHHAPDAASEEPLVALVHIANVLSNALDLAHDPESRVAWMSRDSCAALGLTWGPETQSLFGRIEARSRHAFALLDAF